MNLRTLYAMAAAVACTGCATTGDFDHVGKDAYRATFSDVIRKTLDASKTDNVCLPQLFGIVDATGSAPETVEVALDNTAPPTQTRLAQFRALEAVGLVTGSETTREADKRTLHFVVFRRTAKGVRFFDNGAFCFARATLDTVVKWKGPVALGDYRAAYVYYTTKVGPFADWARDSAVIAAFPTLAALTKAESPKVRQIVIDRSSDGWDVAEYSKLLQLN